MTSENVSIRKDLIARLIKEKKDHETISDVIERYLGKQKTPQDIKRFFGIWKDNDDTFFEAFMQAREIISKDLKKRFEAQ
jgi:predicted CopG family antitoxin